MCTNCEAFIVFIVILSQTEMEEESMKKNAKFMDV